MLIALPHKIIIVPQVPAIVWHLPIVGQQQQQLEQHTVQDIALAVPHLVLQDAAIILLALPHKIMNVQSHRIVCVLP